MNIGGEAVIEGVMMRSQHYYAVSVRRKNKKIVTITGNINSAGEKYKFWKWPLLRGLLAMWESMTLGYKALNFSAQIYEEDYDNNKSAKDKKEADKKNGHGVEMTFSILIAVVLFVALFILVPFYLNKLIALKFKAMATNRYYFNTGMVFFKLVIFFLYVWAISLMEDVKRLFQYHGAEHKTIFAYENNKKLTYDNIKVYSTRHPRCGTAFLVITLIISLVIFILLLPANLLPWQRILVEIPLIIPIVGISYEALKYSAKYQDNFFIKILIAPGLAFQHLTTKEPDKSQIEVAVKSFTTVMTLEKKFKPKKQG